MGCEAQLPQIVGMSLKCPYFTMPGV